MDLRTLGEIAAIADPIERARAVSRAMTEQQGLTEEAARVRRGAIAEARENGHSLEEIARALGVTPGRVSQMRKGPAAKAPAPSVSQGPRVLVQRALPTDPATRGSVSLFLVEAERQGIRPDRRMLYVGLEPASEHVAACLRVDAGDEIVARRKLMLANDVPVRIATSYFRADLFAQTRLAEPEFVKPSLQAAIEALGYTFGHAEETLTARPATRFEADTLELDPGEWVVQVLRASYSTEGTPIHTLETICAATRHIFPIGQVGGLDEF
ncbi:HTH-type transcriptional repressor DasR [Actinomadura rubteroloni]|uniref:HTH-type transcriptional repressor DasR n=1 Tax=Actinomadura rubteroloni TaxID=1926885 RepID=A0A2P4UMG2_9ACTN|nr:UTRA domain-containing protein [Actinomadura rubteroloni]POM26236.1 HTH-type transcriptional repressor DasR [Actinomadura rubteroloni]